MSGHPSGGSRSPGLIASKRSFTSFQEPNHSSVQPGTTKRPRIETEGVEQLYKKIEQQPRPCRLKRPHASFLEDFVDQHYSRPDIILHLAEDDPIPRRLTKSAPGMDRQRDADGFALPPTPTSTGSRMRRIDGEEESVISWQNSSMAPSNTSSSSVGLSRKSLVEDSAYRDVNLPLNNIYLRRFGEQLPESITSLLDEVRKDRDSPGPSGEELGQDISPQKA